MLRARLTGKGRSTLQKCDEALDGIEADTLADVDEAARATLARCLAACAGALRPDARA